MPGTSCSAPCARSDAQCSSPSTSTIHSSRDLCWAYTGADVDNLAIIIAQALHSALGQRRSDGRRLPLGRARILRPVPETGALSSPTSRIGRGPSSMSTPTTRLCSDPMCTRLHRRPLRMSTDRRAALRELYLAVPSPRLSQVLGRGGSNPPMPAVPCTTSALEVRMRPCCGVRAGILSSTRARRNVT